MSEFEWTLPNRLRADFLHGEVAIWNTLPEAAAEIERLRAALQGLINFADHDIGDGNDALDVARAALAISQAGQHLDHCTVQEGAEPVDGASRPALSFSQAQQKP